MFLHRSQQGRRCIWRATNLAVEYILGALGLLCIGGAALALGEVGNVEAHEISLHLDINGHFVTALGGGQDDWRPNNRPGWGLRRDSLVSEGGRSCSKRGLAAVTSVPVDALIVRVARVGA